MASGGDRQRGEGQAGRPTGRPGRGAPPRPGAGPPEPDAVQQQLAELYKGMPLDELTRQGKEHLAGDTRQRAKRAVHLGWVVCWSLVAGGLLLIGIFSLWLLFMAKKSGTSFAHMREQAMSAYSGDE